MAPAFGTEPVCLPPFVYDGQSTCQTTTLNTTSLNAIHVFLCLPRAVDN